LNADRWQIDNGNQPIKSMDHRVEVRRLARLQRRRRRHRVAHTADGQQDNGAGGCPPRLVAEADRDVLQKARHPTEQRPITLLMPFRVQDGTDLIVLPLGNAEDGELLMRLGVELLAGQLARTLTRVTSRLQDRVRQPGNTKRTGPTPRIISQQTRSNTFEGDRPVDIPPRQKGKLGGLQPTRVDCYLDFEGWCLLIPVAPQRVRRSLDASDVTVAAGGRASGKDHPGP
jgi:hypothetical protein